MTITHGLEPYIEESPRQSAEPVQTGERPISIFVQPDVALHGAKAGTERRLLARRLWQILSYASGDTIAACAAALVVRQAVAFLAPLIGTIPIPFASTTEFCLAVLVALVLTGNYQRSTPSHTTLHLLMGSTLGTLVVCWSRLWEAPNLGALTVAVTVAVLTGCALFLTRGGVVALTAWLLPDERRLVPAIVVQSHAAVESALDARSGYRVVGTITLDARHSEARAQELARSIRRARAESVIVFGDVRESVFARVLEIGLRAGCEVLCTPPGYGVIGVRPSIARRGPYGLIRVGAPSLQTHQFIAKRVVDVIGASVGMLVTAPVWLAAAVAIRLDSRGPIFFTQDRVGLGGERFRMIKFRTMRVGADSEKALYAHLNASGDRRNFKIPQDPRISRIGALLRRWSIDELPQFINVIMGHMSLVGPRPVPEDDFVDYEEHHFRRLGAKPGITGLWQVSGRSEVCDFEERVRLDTQYIDEWSLWMDLKIFALTVPAVLRRTGAY